MNYEKYKRDTVKNLGFDPDKLTEDQIDTLLIPVEAPENYYHDGEISHSEAKRIWQGHMRKSGFTEDQIKLATKKHGL